jgi:inosine/xanthosine triphosphate pyrophosphatase family protein
MDFSSVYNTHEKTIFEAVAATAPRYPAIADDSGLLADVACVALNRMPPHYIRHSTDLAFFTTEKERQATLRNVAESVDFAFGYVQARHVMAARR